MDTSLQDFTAVINQRHSVKQYDPTYKMSRDEIKELLELTAKAPSSWNLQHWKFLVFDEQEAKEKLLPIAYNQQQVVQASIVVAILGDLEANKNAERVYSEAVKAGYMPAEIKERLVGQIEQAYAGNPHVARDEAIRNASLAAMQLMLAAKAKGLDTCPMGGFDPAKLVEQFNIPDRYLPVMLISVGKAAQPARPSSRFPLDEVIVWNRFA
jgi:nitroreductase